MLHHIFGDVDVDNIFMMNHCANKIPPSKESRFNKYYSLGSQIKFKSSLRKFNELKKLNSAET